MKKLLLIILLLTAGNAYADTAAARVRIQKQERIENRRIRYYTVRFSVFFPWGTCRTSYRATVPYPNTIRGYACGTYVSCIRTGGTRYYCRF